MDRECKQLPTGLLYMQAFLQEKRKDLTLEFEADPCSIFPPETFHLFLHSFFPSLKFLGNKNLGHLRKSR
ncbi:predicted protein [Sclerotinia sclerotiorum 1980 UF-70]|uniref:Uncharacterized protein n=1 Tax=Sclerotinia sclerotiorum (strain ATCC 18683 / 1980 / Ss-1) TaxID=665079 RepID=A7ELK1_SCLS1|nr:predicted protein [Sclerotinia sclerotiorum 1980 UF-70]EDO03717.1 predicted protein [Sclerotinia sclerotiorum 1980 UF-70]